MHVQTDIIGTVQKVKVHFILSKILLFLQSFPHFYSIFFAVYLLFSSVFVSGM